MRKFNREFDKEVLIIAYQRSGQHGVYSWLFSQLPQPSAVITRIGSGGCFTDFENNRVTPTNNLKLKILGISFEGPISASRIEPINLPKIIIVRDIKNHVASTICMKERISRVGKVMVTPDELRIMKEYLEQAIGIKEYISGPLVIVNFNKWNLSKEYRQSLFYEICAMIEVDAQFTDAGIDYVHSAGGGSSFDKTMIASEMLVNSRYKIPELQAFMSKIPSELLELNRKFFGDIYK